MAYFRGENYIWRDGEDLHLWAREGFDGWNDIGWSFDENNQPYPNASGVAVPEEIIDQFVMMRLAEILVVNSPEEVANFIDDAIGVGNFGSDCLKANAEILKKAFRELKVQSPPRSG